MSSVALDVAPKASSSLPAHALRGSRRPGPGGGLPYASVSSFSAAKWPRWATRLLLPAVLLLGVVMFAPMAFVFQRECTPTQQLQMMQQQQSSALSNGGSAWMGKAQSGVAGQQVLDASAGVALPANQLAVPASADQGECRPGTQRCFPFSTATATTRFPLLTPPPRSGAAAHEEFDLSYSLLSRQHAQPGARSRAPYDADGTPAFRAELQDYIRRHHAATDLRAVERRIAAEVDADLAAAAAAGGEVEGLKVSAGLPAVHKAGLALAARFRRWRSWVESQKYLLYVDGEEGMGNKFQPMVSSFGLALLQKRIFLTHFAVPHLPDLFTIGPRPAPGTEADASATARLPLLTHWHAFLALFEEVHLRLDPTAAGEGSTLPPELMPRFDGSPLPPADLPAARAHALATLGLHAAAADGAAGAGVQWLRSMLAQISPDVPIETRMKANDFAAKHLSLLPSGGALQDGSQERNLKLPTLDIAMCPADSTQQEADLLCNDLLNDERYTTPWVTVGRGYQYFGSMWPANPFTRKRALGWWNEGNIYGPLARFLFNWNEELRQTAHEFAQQHFSRYNIGLQIRMQERLALIEPEVEAAIYAARALAVLHQPSVDESELEVMPAAERSTQLLGMPENTAPANTFGMFLSPAADDADRLARRNKPYVTFYLATDNFPIRKGLVAQLAPYGHVAHSPSEAYPRNKAKGAYYFGAGDEFKEGLKWSVLDSLLLASCDDMITSPSSTFGYVSHGYGSLIPHRVKSSQNPSDSYRPEVLRVLSAEPVSHFWKPLFREVSRWKLCRIEADLPAQAQAEECCPRWSSPHEADQTVQRLLQLWKVG